MEILQQNALLADFPATPRQARLRPMVWIAVGGISAIAAFVCLVVLIFTLSDIEKQRLFLRTAVKVDGLIAKKDYDLSRNSRSFYLWYEASTPHGRIFDRTRVPIEVWDKHELNHPVSIWYSTENKWLSGLYPPKVEDVDRVVAQQNLFLSTILFATLAILGFLAHLIRKEWNLATAGLTRLATYELLETTVGRETKRKVKWTFLDEKGEHQTRFQRLNSFAVALKASDQQILVLVDTRNKTDIKPWQSFRWVDIRTS